MKESIGGTLLLNLMLFFMVIYILFMAGIMKYASAMKAKNAIVEIIENARTDVTCNDYKQALVDGGYGGTFVIEEHKVEYPNSISKNFYTVRLTSDIPVLPGILSFKIPIVGETKMIDPGIKIAHTSGQEITVLTGTCTQ